MTLRIHDKIIYKTNVTCPGCGCIDTRVMKFEVVEQTYHCPSCQNVYAKKLGSCCIYCSYGSKNCPVIQDIQLKLNH
ncbi:GDCCVxC domain-containing (seleno)protein [Leucothrix pacifica]|uniref:GDCCVxC domain-containing (seleno)protein n=1 Tax=Leucothrix pacifica TaxID=1247513 RepID=UPI003CCC62F9